MWARAVRRLLGRTMTQALADQVKGMGIRDPRVLAAMARLDRRRFVPAEYREQADDDRPLPIGCGQTISQPLMVALMTEALTLGGDEKVLEVGTGCGYQAAVLAALCGQLYSVEIIPELADRARRLLLEELELDNVHLAQGDGARGWPDEAPFDRIVITAATPTVPPALLEQLAPGGRLLLPLGEPGDVQQLHAVDLDWEGRRRDRDLGGCRFVPLTTSG